jgi:hypothetical protein
MTNKYIYCYIDNEFTIVSFYTIISILIFLFFVITLLYTGPNDIESHDPTLFRNVPYLRMRSIRDANSDNHDALYIKLFGQNQSRAQHSIFSYFWGIYTLDSYERLRVNRAAMTAEQNGELAAMDLRFENGALRTMNTATCPKATLEVILIIRRYDPRYVL